MKVNKNEFTQKYIYNRTFRYFFPSILRFFPYSYLSNIISISHFFNCLVNWANLFILDNKLSFTELSCMCMPLIYITCFLCIELIFCLSFYCYYIKVIFVQFG